MNITLRNAHIAIMIEEIMNTYWLQIYATFEILFRLMYKKRERSSEARPYHMLNRIPTQVHRLNRFVHISDIECVVNLCMDRNTFGRLCLLLKELGGLNDGRYVTVEEQVAVFIGILGHHKKVGTVKFHFWLSTQTISHYMHLVLKSVILLHKTFLVKPIPVQEDSTDPRWKWFKGCLGALDGTYINVSVPTIDKPRYRTRKGEISTNTLAVCNRDLEFVYVLPGWEGSATDGRVLRDAVNREWGLKVPRGFYYLCNNGYANSDGFLTPYKGVRYHLKEWGPDSAKPKNREELFGMRHTRARNVIERAFGVIKKRWAILRSASYYPVKVQTRLIMACFLLRNFIRAQMIVDPIEMSLVESEPNVEDDETHDEVPDLFIDMVEETAAWTNTRDVMAQEMWDNYNVA